MQAIISFLTIIPVPKSSIIDINSVANKMHFFPLAGAMIGSLIGGMAYGISFYLQPPLIGFLVTCTFMIITGIHHTDALADFADGLMAKGSKDIKYKVMHEPAVGSAGVSSIILYITGMIISISSFHHGIRLFASIIAAEVIAKYVMVLQSYRGLSAWEGFSSPFTSAMKDKRKILTATAITLPIVYLFGGGYYAGPISLAVSAAIATIIQYVSNKTLGGITGDVLGASNELARLSSLIVLSSVTI